jgi:hypothetical protein
MEKCSCQYPASLSGGLLLHRTPRSIKGRIHQRNRLGIRVRNEDTPELCPADLMGRLSFLPPRVVQSKIGVGIAVWNAIDGDGANVCEASRCRSTGTDGKGARPASREGSDTVA